MSEGKPAPQFASYTEDGVTFSPVHTETRVGAAHVYYEIGQIAEGNTEEEERMLAEIDELEDLPEGSTKVVLSGKQYVKVTKVLEDSLQKKQSAEHDIERGTYS